MSLGVMLAATMGLGEWFVTPKPQDRATVAQDSAGILRPEVPAPWLQGDPADSLYRAAREALNGRDYAHAADLFGQIPTRFPRSGYVADSFYWSAFSLYRLGGESQLRAGLAALRAQSERFPKAATRGDAAALERRIQGELARRGDSQAAADITRAANAAVQPPEAPEAPEAPVAPEPPEPPSGPEGGCESEADDTKLAALSALQQMDDERARPILRRVLARRDPASVCLRRKAVFLIAQESEGGTEEILLNAARTDPDHEVREQAVFWLSQVNTDRAVSALDSILRSSKDAAIQEKAVFALSQQGSPRAQQALRGYAERAELAAAVREKVIFWIGQSGGAENEAFLRSLYGRLKDEGLRNKILFSVSQAGGPENVRWLLGIARDATQPLELRKQALFWAGQTGASMADLAGLYTSMTDRAMREQLIFVYSQREEPAAVDKLLDIAKSDSDPELRKKALFWLGQSDDPRAAKALQDIIEKP
ncbi:MAG TPA: HEAT repeat domain-containing protein [Gemmatimonadales bacterium]|nr:HEAT repeat domain-containing protein [Gemmatimonadales bacterium]